MVLTQVTGIAPLLIIIITLSLYHRSSGERELMVLAHRVRINPFGVGYFVCWETIRLRLVKPSNAYAREFISIGQDMMSGLPED